MRSVSGWTKAILCLAWVGATFGGYAEVAIKKVLPFASDEEVAIEVTLRCDERQEGAVLLGHIVPVHGGETLWEGTLAKCNLESGTTTLPRYAVKGLRPKLWSPGSPFLYQLTVTLQQRGRPLADAAVRFGFRSVESRQGQVLLNGKPLFLRGVAINPPGRDIPNELGKSRAFAEDYVRFMKDHNVNIIRLMRDSQVWFDVCDELGMLVYQGRYGKPPGGTNSEPPEDFETTIAEYKSQHFVHYVHHPSIIIYVLANEIPYRGDARLPYVHFMQRIHNAMRQWDPTRVYIGNAGYGDGRSGDIYDFHRYWGWYYNSFLTFYGLRDFEDYNLLRAHPDENPQPITMTECVGSYTMPDGRFNRIRKQGVSAMRWTGYAEDQAGASLDYQAFLIQQAAESFRRLRAINPRLAGIMPFTILFFHWSDIACFDDMKPKPAMLRLEQAYQPVLLSWELWTPQVYAGSSIQPIAHVVNDSEDGEGIAGARLQYRLTGPGDAPVLAGEVALPDIPYYEVRRVPLSLVLPKRLQTGDYVLFGEVVQGGRTISQNSVSVFIAAADSRPRWKDETRLVLLYDPPGDMAAALEHLGFPFRRINDLRDAGSASVIVIGEASWDEVLSVSVKQLAQFVQAGGRILVMRQPAGRFDWSWLPVRISPLSGSPLPTQYPPPERYHPEGGFINPLRRGHPVFEGLPRERLALWSDYTGWDQTQPGYPSLFPVTGGFSIYDPESLGHIAILANYGQALEAVALCEVFDGQGSVVLSGFDLVRRIGRDPAADRMLSNLLAYVASKEEHEVHPRIDSPIVWGDFPSERGLITGRHNGLIENVALVDPDTGRLLKSNQNNAAGWNSNPGRQYTVWGRRPLGPYTYSSSGAVQESRPAAATGWGRFWVRIPGGSISLVTTVENPTDAEAYFQAAVNQEPGDEWLVVPSSGKVIVRTSLPPGAEEVEVHYEGSKELAIVKTAFE